MFVRHIHIKNYKPFLHGGTTELKVDVHGKLVIIIGGNGSGKSSLAREITVLPAVSSDYEKGGFRTIGFDHDGLDYRLSSSFEKSKGEHLFFKGEENLNLALNSTAQSSLATGELGMDTIIKELCSGKMLISTKSRVERKKFLFSCYPSDLTFMLKHHAHVVKQIKAIKSNLKMLSNRKVEIADKLMEDTEYERLTNIIEAINEKRVTITNCQFQLEEEVKELEALPDYQSRLNKDNSLNHDKFRNNCSTLLRRAQVSTLNNPQLASSEYRERLNVITTTQDRDKKRADELFKASIKLKEEIEEFEQVADQNLTEELDTVKELIVRLKRENDSITIDSNLPEISNEAAELIDLEEIENQIDLLKAEGCELIPTKKIEEMRVECENQRHEVNKLAYQLKTLADQYDSALSRLRREQGAGYNPKCALPCQLKSNYNTVVEEIQTDVDSLKERLDKVMLEHHTAVDKLTSLGNTFTPLQRVFSSIKYFEVLFIQNQWFADLYPNKTLFPTLNNNANSISNLCVRIKDKAYDILQKKNISEELRKAEYRLKVIEETKLPARELIAKALINKHVEFKFKSAEFDKIQRSIKSSEKEINSIQSYKQIENNVEHLEKEFTARSNFNIIAGRIDVIHGMLHDLNERRKELDEQQNEIKGTVREQHEIRISLTNEINPMIEKLNAELKDRVDVEKLLSPNTGLPHLYMVRFLNGIIAQTNDYIRMVWSHDMEIRHLSEDETLDFSFKVIHKTKTEVSDINLCSKGEQEMINLAFMIALGSQMKILQNYPLVLDEIDSGFSAGHKTRLITLLRYLIDNDIVSQLFMINHNVEVFTSIQNVQTICLNEEGVVLPPKYNEGVEIY